MNIKIEKVGNFIVFTNTDTSSDIRYLSEFLNWDIGDNDTTLSFTNKLDGYSFHYSISVLLNKDDETWSVPEWKEWLSGKIGVPGTQDVLLQDQHSPVIIASMSLLEQETLLTTTVAIDDRTITVDDPTGFTEGKYVSIFNVVANRVYLGNILSTSGNPITLDTRMDFAYPSGSFVTSGITNMNVNGSVTPIIFGLRNTDVAIGSSFDITQLRITCLTSTPVDLSKFGDIVGGISNGLILRRVDGETRNIFNVKTNRDISNIMNYDPQSAINPAQGQDGFIAVLKFAGQNEVGVTLRLEPGEDVQIIIPDDLTSLIDLTTITEGHIVVD